MSGFVSIKESNVDAIQLGEEVYNIGVGTVVGINYSIAHPRQIEEIEVAYNSGETTSDPKISRQWRQMFSGTAWC